MFGNKRRKNKWRVRKIADTDHYDLHQCGSENYCGGTILNVDKIKDVGADDRFWQLFYHGDIIGTIYKKENEIVNLDGYPQLVKKVSFP